MKNAFLVCLLVIAAAAGQAMAGGPSPAVADSVQTVGQSAAEAGSSPDAVTAGKIVNKVRLTDRWGRPVVGAWLKLMRLNNVEPVDTCHTDRDGVAVFN
ncbi:MAG: hypothetical protein N3A57_07875, partial [Negativicutes bacterium]|nr:hypothetical protein [Negativicutes bacterium]